MVASRVFVRSEAGKFYMDVRAAQAFRQRRRRRTLYATLVLLAGGSFLLLLTRILGRR
jgi:hypothetical protein